MAFHNTTVPNERLLTAADDDQLPRQTPCTDIETVRTKLTTSGAMFRTMKIVSDEPRDDDAAAGPCRPAKHRDPSPPHPRKKKQAHRQQAVFGGLPKHLPLSGIEQLTSRLVATLNEEVPTNQIKLFGPFIGEVPRRLGSTTALNDAAACLTTTHDAIIRKHSKVRINPQLYARALKSLHTAIEDPLQVKSTSTLCATVLLAITEAYALGVCGTNRNFITHLGGAARILELRGAQEFQNPSSFERALLRAVTVGVGLEAIFTDKADILTSPEWHDIAFDTDGIAEPRASMFRISRAMAFLPALNRDIRAFFAGNAPADTTPLSLLHRAESLRDMLDEVRPYIEELLADPTRVRRVTPSPEHADLWPFAYRFADAGVAFVLWFFWNMRMITSSIIVGLHRRPASAPFLPPRPAYLAALEREAVAMARDVCMSWEHARAVRPLGAMYIDVALIVSYNLFAQRAGPDGRRRQAWILAALEELTEGYPGEGSREWIAGREFAGVDWTEERVEWLGAWFTAGCVGRGDGEAAPDRSAYGSEEVLGDDDDDDVVADADLLAAASSCSAPAARVWAECHGRQGRHDGWTGSRVDGACGDADSGGAVTGAYAWSPGSSTDSFLVLQPTGMKVRWHTTNLAGGSFA
ncbi:putative zn 2cys6 transcription factor protein [Neofusicoccum parvum UCRNP2]|uniref:Putative zn 2cys6 transcription factor protein n=1 Tax=Botryosphaeria parva (strain UCR-NP2) TaxID=1287680 RepID=R1GDE2_BOTPV|nr:putative zn 2cys6 transcription factor protein [Neofusicoccum parvum UCRNP2]